jgi:hypothetical protein
MLNLQCVILISAKTTKKTDCRQIQSPSAKPGLDIVIVGLAVVIVGLDIAKPFINKL